MTRRWLLVALGAVILLAAAVSALATAEVVARGKLVPSGGTNVRRVRVWDSVEFYISSETARPSWDVVTTIAFAMLAAILGFAALVLVVGGVHDRRTLCFSIAAVGAAYLAADELLAIHESSGHNLQFLRHIPGVERPDDLVLMSYLFPVGAFGWFFRDLFVSVRAPVVFFVAALVFAVVAAALDLAAVGNWEERTEAVTAILVGTGFAWLAAVSVPEALASGGRARPVSKSR